MVAIPMLMMLRDVIRALGKLPVVVFLMAILILKWPPSRFQNGRHFQHILDYISASELPRELKIVAIPMFVMLKIAINALGKLLVVLSATILNFPMAAI